jgi:hypothetical protein
MVKTPQKRVFILGAGFSKPANMPLATELLSPLLQKTNDDEMNRWLSNLQDTINWLSGNDGCKDYSRLNIEEVFHYGQFDIEVFRLRQHGSPVGRDDGLTPWNSAEHIEIWLYWLERELCDVIFEKDENADLDPILRWAKTIGSQDSIITFNYDTLVERALTSVCKSWNHGFIGKEREGISVFKLHGSIDWKVVHRSQDNPNCELLFDKENANRQNGDSDHVEDDYRLWRYKTRDKLHKWIKGRHLQISLPSTVGIAGLGAYKQPHKIPGLYYAWAHGMHALYEADLGIIVGFSMSDFDAMAQLQFAAVAKKRKEEGRPLKMIVIDPCVNEKTKKRFQNVFRLVEFRESPHENIDWNDL